MEPLSVKNGQIATGFDLFSNEEYCTPSVFGFSACIGANAVGEKIILVITLKTPFGNYSKSFEFDNNVCFEWYPIPVAGVKICIKDFKVDGGRICFTLSGELCAKIPFIGEKCIGLQHEFCVPIPLGDLQTNLASGDLEERDWALALAMAMVGKEFEDHGCDCN